MSSPIVFEVEVDTEVASVGVEAAKVSVTPAVDEQVIYAVDKGIKGDQGDPGAAFEGVAWWYGAGPPSPSPVGAKVGDFYLDTVDGTIYVLGGV